jgi:hypothetical protein
LNRYEAWRYKPATISSIFSRSLSMSELLAYGRMAEAHWREHRPRMVKELEAEGRLEAALLEAQEQTTRDLVRLIRDFRRQGLSPQQAHDQAWELVREKYILLPPEVPEPE